MSISSIHIEAGAGGFFAHNSRESKTENSIFSTADNFCSATKDEAFKIYRDELKIRSAAYTKRTNQKLQKNAITHLSAIVNLQGLHSSKDIKLICDYLEETLDTKIIQYAVHKDEGHMLNDATDEARKQHALKTSNDEIVNNHGHIEMLGLDSEGRSVRKKLTKKYLSDLQTKVSELLNMERGARTMLDDPNTFYKQILKEMPKTDNLADFKKAYISTGRDIKYRDKPKAKRKSTKHYKTDKEQEAKTITLAKQKDLKAEISKLRAELKSKSATREEYASLEQLNRTLKERIKNKDLSIEELKAEATKEESKICSIVAKTGQQKIFYNKYKENIDNDLKSYSINTDEDTTIFRKKASNIEIQDNGDSLVSMKNDSQNLQERVSTMLDIAVAKGWKLTDINIEGSHAFTSEIHKQIAQREATINKQKVDVINNWIIAKFDVKEGVNKWDKVSTFIKEKIDNDKKLINALESIKELEASISTMNEDNSTYKQSMSDYKNKLLSFEMRLKLKEKEMLNKKPSFEEILTATENLSAYEKEKLLNSLQPPVVISTKQQEEKLVESLYELKRDDRLDTYTPTTEREKLIYCEVKYIGSIETMQIKNLLKAVDREMGISESKNLKIRSVSSIRTVK